MQGAEQREEPPRVASSMPIFPSPSINKPAAFLKSAPRHTKTSILEGCADLALEMSVSSRRAASLFGC
jgi:hypothetical protein